MLLILKEAIKIASTNDFILSAIMLVLFLGCSSLLQIVFQNYHIIRIYHKLAGTRVSMSPKGSYHSKKYKKVRNFTLLVRKESTPHPLYAILKKNFFADLHDLGHDRKKNKKSVKMTQPH